MKWSTVLIMLLIVYLLLFTSLDGDRLTTYEELSKGTNPFIADTDRDGLNDSYEVGNPKLDALSKDVLVEVDYDAGKKPRGDFNNIKQLFANAPVDNVDGSKGIDLHINIDDRVYVDEKYSVSDYRGTQPSYDNKEAIHVVVVDDVRRKNDDVGGVAILGTNGALVQGDDYNRLSFVVLHELGHQLGLTPADFDGVDSKSYSSKEYNSVMNYNCNSVCDLTFSNSEPFNDWEHIENTLSER